MMIVIILNLLQLLSDTRLLQAYSTPFSFPALSVIDDRLEIVTEIGDEINKKYEFEDRLLLQGRERSFIIQQLPSELNPKEVNIPLIFSLRIYVVFGF